MIETHDRWETPDLTVIIISTNEGDVLDACLASVFQNAGRWECLVFNNASTDHTAYLLKEKYKDERLTVVDNPVKRGFIENNNVGLRLARGRYVLLLNPDTVVQSDTLEVMVRFMDTHPKAAVSTCRLIYADGAPQDNVRRFPTLLTYLYRIPPLDRIFRHHKLPQRYLMADMDREKTQEVDWFITAFFFLRKSAVDEIGLLDKHLLQPFYIEDLEWCYRAKLRGYRSYYVAETAVVHDYQQSSRKRFGRLTLVHLCNVLLFFQKHGWSILTRKVISA